MKYGRWYIAHYGSHCSNEEHGKREGNQGTAGARFVDCATACMVCARPAESLLWRGDTPTSPSMWLLLLVAGLRLVILAPFIFSTRVLATWYICSRLMRGKYKLKAYYYSGSM